MIIETKTLAVHSIQANMLGTQQDGYRINVLLANGKTLRITCLDESEAREVDIILNFYPSVGKENNSTDLRKEVIMEVI